MKEVTTSSTRSRPPGSVRASTHIGMEDTGHIYTRGSECRQRFSPEAPLGELAGRSVQATRATTECACIQRDPSKVTLLESSGAELKAYLKSTALYKSVSYLDSKGSLSIHSSLQVSLHTPCTLTPHRI